VSADVIARMWEVRAHPQRLADLIEWVCDRAVPAIEVEPLHIASEVFSSADNRVVVISKWRGTPVPLADPPAEMVARSPHCWDFAPVDR
jgi:hypothetical protein